MCYPLAPGVARGTQPLLYVIDKSIVFTQEEIVVHLAQAMFEKSGKPIPEFFG